jgi:hypothetical protein
VMGMMTSSYQLLLGSKVVIDTFTSSCSWLLWFSYFSELVKSLKLYLNGFENI